ncbi:MAG: hypothetical protein QXO27_04045 [Candidatus Aenigmatarchaeota archaeon]
MKQKYLSFGTAAIMIIILIVIICFNSNSKKPESEKYCSSDNDCKWVNCCPYSYKCMNPKYLDCPKDIICLAFSQPRPSDPCMCINNICVNPEKYCEQDTDCDCGRHKTTGECFYGNKNYVNTTKQCPDFCTGIAGNLKIICKNNECVKITS